MVPPFDIENNSFVSLCEEIELRYVLNLASSSSSSPNSLQPLLTALLHTLQEGKHFIKGCTQNWIQALIRPSSKHWLINTALPIALSTEIFDVHLHDLVCCISTLIWVLTDSAQDIQIQAEKVDSLLKIIWPFASEEDDVKLMQEFFNRIGAKGNKIICDLICHRLCESTSRAKLNLTGAVVPTYLWMDPQNFETTNDPMLGTNTVVFETRFMGGRFARKHFPPEHEEVFANEAVIQSRLRHANVVQLVCCTRKASGYNICHNLVMELMQEDLGSLISNRRSPFSLLAGVDLMLQIAKGMEYLHDLGIMHRDLKSFNILVSNSQRANEGGHLTAKVADFGTVKVKRDTSMYTTKRIGTSIWRAPEVLDDEDDAKYSRKADVYSFAIVCSEILTGLPAPELLPYKQISELLQSLKDGRRPKLPSDCYPAIASYIEKCWDGDASKRPTFKKICKVFRFFKACILLEETEILNWRPLPDGMFDFEGTSNHPFLLDIPSEMHVFKAFREMQEMSSALDASLAPSS